MNIKDYQMQPQKPLTFDEWKGNVAPVYSGEKLKSYNRLHNLDYEKEFNEMLQTEYAEYLSNLNGDWLLK